MPQSYPTGRCSPMAQSLQLSVSVRGWTESSLILVRDFPDEAGGRLWCDLTGFTYWCCLPTFATASRLVVKNILSPSVG
jgi:hypothetical protein